ncbi:MAG TPA: tryptophan synthase subunit alpha [Candidatus Pelethocola excrementipullorum]|nr:tryptophan synthase subunit alpha [Candidatus Pelethocola excrementipullorum]
MNRIEKAFKDGKAFIPFITAGDPSLDKTEDYIVEMVKAGADIVEIGIPFSDPIAEGSVIQEADIRALASGTTTDKIFDMVVSLRKKTDVPLIFMTYLNPVFHYGYDKFFARCQETGIDGIIIPDVPFEEKEEITESAGRYGITVISMIAPTSESRIQAIASEAEGFIYVVSSMGVTGVRSEINTDLNGMLSSIKEVTKVPAAVGFGINTPKQAADIAQTADGVIVGSAIVKMIAQYGRHADHHIYTYVRLMKEAITKE